MKTVHQSQDKWVQFLVILKMAPISPIISSYLQSQLLITEDFELQGELVRFIIIAVLNKPLFKDNGYCCYCKFYWNCAQKGLCKSKQTIRDLGWCQHCASLRGLKIQKRVDVAHHGVVVSIQQLGIDP
ncbi:MAG: hypothetical protein EZS28_049930 [Streblomastix strix]|uniref:Uncharacterized protein n=1 Tax=Streblomastix strix TaxID=222440 RepID=A0A5J4T998_9EUKA|nr:MAG: hypothetical protein EZS28_049930 [Streblomastix strix]